MSWFVRNVRDAQWWDRGPRGCVAELVEDDDAEVSVNLFILGPGEPMSMYHWEAKQEDFLVLSGEAVLVIEDEERPLGQWDFFHCPPNVSHTIVGSGSGPAAILALGPRIDSRDNWGGYQYSEPAMKHDASAEEETTKPEVAYARFPARELGEFREGWLPN